MHSTPNLSDSDPHDIFVIEPDVSLAAGQDTSHATHEDKAPLDLLYDVLSRPSNPASSHLTPDPELRIAPDFSAGGPAPSVDLATHQVADDVPTTDIKLGDSEINAHQPTTSKFARGVAMSLFALLSATGAAAWQHYGDDAKTIIANWTPSFALASTPRPAAAEPAQSASLVPVTTDSPATSDSSQQIQTMAREIAAMGQQIGELKATIEQLKANQAQAAQSAPAKATEARLAEPIAPIAPVTRPKIVPPPAHSTVATLARRPKHAFPYAPIAPTPPPQQAASAAPAPVQIAPKAEDGGPVVRPPLPLH